MSFLWVLLYSLVTYTKKVVASQKWTMDFCTPPIYNLISQWVFVPYFRWSLMMMTKSKKDGIVMQWVWNNLDTMHTALLISKAGLECRCFDWSQMFFRLFTFFLSILEICQLLIHFDLKKFLEFIIIISWNKCQIWLLRPQ